MLNPFIKKILDDQNRNLEEAREECIREFGERSLFETFKPIYNETVKNFLCPAYWDGILCWPDTKPNTLASKSCPSYFTGFLPHNNATRKCMENGTWFTSAVQNASWTNYTSCYKEEKTTIIVDLHKPHVSSLLLDYFPLVKIISQTGYTVSLCSLVVAFLIILLNKKLHCARNILHMHLFASFIFRAFIFIVKDFIFVDGIGLSTDVATQNGSHYFNIDSETNNWTCKLLTSLWQYSITANYSWILMEGLYLHSLIFRALFVDSCNNIRWYIIFGWGLPLLVIAKWVIVRLLVEDTFCWTTHDNYKIYLIIAVPTMISILINLVLFIRISMVLYSKLRSPINDDSQRYRKWAKSTLVLVPLFGVHYALFLGLYYTIKTNRVVELIWLICDRLFGSFQGFFVAILYCFLNGEVKAELKPIIYTCLVHLATNPCFKYCFPYRNQFLRSAVGRQSVCTTLSCSSLFNNGIIRRNSKCRCEFLPKKSLEKLKQCQNGQELMMTVPKCHQNKNSLNYFRNNTAETTLSIENQCEYQENEEIARMTDDIF